MSELTRFLRERIEKQEQSGWRKKKKEKIAIVEIEKFMKKIKGYLSGCIQEELIEFNENTSKMGKWETYEIPEYSIRFLDKKIYIIPMPQQKHGEKLYDGGINLSQSFLWIEVLDDETAMWTYKEQFQIIEQNFTELMNNIFIEKLSERE